jgi:purine-nucleoside phosphorylase
MIRLALGGKTIRFLDYTHAVVRGIKQPRRGSIARRNMVTTAFAKLESACFAKRPLAAIVLGSGLNAIADDWPLLHAVPFGELPEMPSTSIAGHKGRLCLHEFAGSAVLVFQGRLHYYEGHSRDVVERPIRIAHELGVRMLILTNAAGGIGPKQDAGSLMAIRDHIAANRPDWWKSLALESAKPASPYAIRLNAILLEAATEIRMDLPEGVYAYVTGPNYETPAEVRALRVMGADAVGMSTVHEALTATSLGMEVAAISCIANRAAGLSASPLSHAEVLAVVNSAAERMGQLLKATLHRLAKPQSQFSLPSRSPLL